MRRVGMADADYANDWVVTCQGEWPPSQAQISSVIRVQGLGVATVHRKGPFPSELAAFLISLPPFPPNKQSLE
jgi:hypothetical protein